MPNYKSTQRFLFSLLIGSIAGYLCSWALMNAHIGAADFGTPLRMARDLWQGHDPYDHPVPPDPVLYPVTAGLVAFPFACLSDNLAAGIFFGLSSALLAWCLLGAGQPWRLLFFFSWPFFYALLYAQWSPLLTCMWFLAPLLPLILVKPHVAIPLAATGSISRTGVFFTLFLFIASLFVYPSWPWVWIHRVHMYDALRPPLFALPLGPLILIALRRYRERRAWLLLLMAAMPQRVIYDQLPLLLVANTPAELLVLAVCSWLSLPLVWSVDGWYNVPGRWQLWILLTLYLPALVVILRADIEAIIGRLRSKAGDATL